MKKYLLTLLASVLGACTASVPENTGDGSSITFTATSDALTTRSSVASTMEENTLKRLHLLVFHDDGGLLQGLLENCFYFEPSATSLSASVKVTRGNKKLLFVANMPRDYAANVTSLEDALRPSAWTYAQNGPLRGALVMTATTEVEARGPTAALGTVYLRRHVSRIEVQKICNHLPTGSGTVRLAGIYLQNVARQQGNTTWADAQYWRKDSPDLETVLPLLDGGATALIPAGGDWNAPAGGYLLYGYPNAAPQCDDGRQKDWVTKLVVELNVGSQTWYYPIGIPDMASNTCYILRQIDIRRSGSSDPDHYVTTRDVSVTMDIEPWTDGPYDEIMAGDRALIDTQCNLTL